MKRTILILFLICFCCAFSACGTTADNAIDETEQTVDDAVDAGDEMVDDTVDAGEDLVENGEDAVDDATSAPSADDSAESELP